ncbi:MAG TPA: YncE family protein [Mycobacteriales bacterium]|nr:YncE family protein [Mycobacteriales bacterium]
MRPVATRVLVSALVALGSLAPFANEAGAQPPTTSVPIGAEPRTVTITPDGRLAYVTNEHAPTLTVVDTATRAVVATVPIGGAQGSVAVTPDSRFAYVTWADTGSHVAVIDTSTNSVVDTISVGNSPAGIAVSPNGQRVYVADYYANAVSVIDTASNAVVDTIGVGSNPSSVAITPDGRFAYVADAYQTGSSGQVSVIDTTTDQVTQTVSGLGGEPWDIAITPDGRFAYVADFGGQVDVIDTAHNTLSATVKLEPDSAVQGVAIAPNGQYAYVTDSRGNTNSFTVKAIRISDNKVVASVDVGASPDGIAITPDGRFAYVADNSGDVTVIDLGSILVPTKLVAAPALLQESPLASNAFDLKVTLSRRSDGTPVAGKLIRMSAKGTVLCTATTNAQGAADCKAPLDQTLLKIVQQNGYIAVFPGDSQYATTSATGKLVG